MSFTRKVITAAALSLALWAGSSSASGQEYIYPLTLLDGSPRTMAMGGVSLGEATSDYLYTNPTSLLRGDSWLYASVNGGLFSKVKDTGTPKVFTGSIGAKRWGVALMAGMRYKGGLKMPKYDENGIPIEGKSITLADRSIDFGAAYSPFRSLPLGFYAKYSYYLTSYGRSAAAHSFTVGTSYRHRFAARDGSLTDHVLTGTIELAEVGMDFRSGKRTTLSLPSNVAGAVSWEYALSDLKLDTSLGLQGRYFFRPAKRPMLQLGLGGEVTYDKLVSLRLGYQYAWRNLSFVGCGVGVKLPYVDLHLGSHISLAKDEPMHSYLLGVSFQM